MRSVSQPREDGRVRPAISVPANNRYFCVLPPPNKQETHGLTGGQGNGTDPHGWGTPKKEKKKSHVQVAGKKNIINHFPWKEQQQQQR